MYFTQVIDDAIGQEMAEDEKIIVFGEGVSFLWRSLLTRFGPQRIRNTPISESAFLGAGVAAAMAGLRSVIDVYMVDFLGVAMDALLNHAAKLEVFSGGKWKAPLVVRAPCGGGYGVGGQHMQSLWGWIAHIPGLSIVVPSTPEDAGRLLVTALQHNGPVIYMEHKLLSETAREFWGSGGRKTVKFDLPAHGIRGPVPQPRSPLPFGKAHLRRQGSDITFASVGVGVHRALQAAEEDAKDGLSIGLLDLRTLSPLDKRTLCEQIANTGRLLVVDEDYESFGLSGELAAVVLEAGIPVRYARVCTTSTIPYSRHLENEILPNGQRIQSSVCQLMASEI